MAVTRRCANLGLPCWVSLERVMKCGLGICGACHCGEYLVCADGPVFPGEVLLRASDAMNAGAAASDTRRSSG